MSAPAIGVRRNFLPATGRVDWSHPLTQGLHAIRTPWGVEGPAGGWTSRELVPSRSTGGFGFTGSTGSTSDAVVGFQTGPWSHVIALTPLSVAGQSFMAMSELPGSGTSDRVTYINATPRYVGSLFDGATKTAVSTSVPTVGKMDILVVTCDGSTLALWVNGAREATTAVSNVGFAGFASPELVWGRDTINGSAQLQSCIHYAGMWRRVLSNAEIGAIQNAPFDMFRT